MASTIQQEDHHQHHKVLITKSITVHPRAQPLEPQQPTLLQLSNLDRKCPLLMYLVFFYHLPLPLHKGPLSGDHHSLFTSLKMGLEETLSAWYPAAGRLSLNPATGTLDLDCCSSGAVLVEAATEVKISDLGDLSHYNEFFETLVFRPPLSPNLSGVPLVVAQVTKFGCGGYALGVGTNHSLFDGVANFNFMRAWACKTAGRADVEVELAQPVHERGRLLVGHGQTLNLIQTQEDLARADGGVDGARVMAFDHLHKLIKQAASMESMGSCGKLVGCNLSVMGGNTSKKNFVLKTFSVSSAMARKLKIMASSGLSDCSCSSFEVIAAHLWKARTKALEIPEDRMVCLQFAVDTRNRMVPPLPKGFTGNAYVLSSISCTGGELAEEPLPSVVGKIKRAKSGVTDGYVQAYLEALEAPSSTLPPLLELTIVSDWTRTPYHEVDFGLGGAAYVSPLAPPVQQVGYFMQSPREVEGVDVRIGLMQEHVVAFTHYFLDVLS